MPRTGVGGTEYMNTCTDCAAFRRRKKYLFMFSVCVLYVFRRKSQSPACCCFETHPPWVKARSSERDWRYLLLQARATILMTLPPAVRPEGMYLWILHFPANLAEEPAVMISGFPAGGISSSARRRTLRPGRQSKPILAGSILRSVP